MADTGCAASGQWAWHSLAALACSVAKELQVVGHGCERDRPLPASRPAGTGVRLTCRLLLSVYRLDEGVDGEDHQEVQDGAHQNKGQEHVEEVPAGQSKGNDSSALAMKIQEQLCERVRQRQQGTEGSWLCGSPVVENRAVDREGESAKHLLGPAAAGQQAGRHEASKARGWVGCARWASLRGTSLPNVRT